MQDLLTKASYRPSLLPGIPLPMGGRSVGHYRKPQGWRDGEVRKPFVQLFWSSSGEGWIGFEQEQLRFPPGHLAIYFPGDLHQIGTNAPGRWEYRWFTMDGMLAEGMVRAFGLERGRLYAAGAPPVALFEQLHTAICDLSAGGERRAGAAAYELLSAAAQAAGTPEGRPPSDDFEARAMAHLHERWNDPSFGVEPLADAMGLHRSRLSRHFQATFGMSPSAYLQRWRVQNAMTLLKGTSLPVHEVALRCGFTDPNYFARVMSRATGKPPGAFRRES